jgi:hypothetical protein
VPSVRVQRIATDKLAAAVYNVKDQYGAFLFAARDTRDFHDRVALCKDDMLKTVEPHLFPRTGVMRRICKQLEREFKTKQADKVIDTDETYHPSDEPLIPEGDFHGYQDSVDQGGPEKVDANVFTGEGTEHTGDPADTDFVKGKESRRRQATGTGEEVVQPAAITGVPGMPAGASSFSNVPGVGEYDVVSPMDITGAIRHFAAWCREAGVKANLNSLDRYAHRASDRDYFAIASALQRQADGEATPYQPQGTGELLSDLPGSEATPPSIASTGIGIGTGLESVSKGAHRASDRDYCVIASALQRQAAECGANAEDGGACTRTQGHIGDHVERAGDDFVQRWSDARSDKAHVDDPWEKKSRLHTAGPDYLQKANEALTNVLNQKAEEMQEEVAPLQQALQVVQQALTEQQAANPFNVMPGGSLDVMPPAPAGAGTAPAQDPMAAGGAPDPSMGGAPPVDPSMIGGAPPADPSMGGVPADEGQLPPELQQQMMLQDKRGGCPKASGATRPRPASTVRLADVLKAWQDWQTKRPQKGTLGIGGQADYDTFAQETGAGQRAIQKLRKHLEGEPAAPAPVTAKSATRKEAWTGWGVQPESGTRKVAGFLWDAYLNGYVAHTPGKFACVCGTEIATPSGFQRCACGKQWNSYVIGTGGDRHEASAEKYLVREIPTRDGVIVASKTACDDSDDDQDDDSDDKDDEKKLPWEKGSSRDFAEFVAHAYAARESSIFKLTEPGELGEGEDPGTATIGQQPEDWARRNPDGKWNKGPRRSV